MLYAQINEDGICTCIGTPKTDIEVSDYTNLGKKYIGDKWEDVAEKLVEKEPTNKEVMAELLVLKSEIANMKSDVSTISKSIAKEPIILDPIKGGEADERL